MRARRVAHRLPESIARAAAPRSTVRQMATMTMIDPRSFRRFPRRRYTFPLLAPGPLAAADPGRLVGEPDLAEKRNVDRVLVAWVDRGDDGHLVADPCRLAGSVGRRNKHVGCGIEEALGIPDALRDLVERRSHRSDARPLPGRSLEARNPVVV